MVHAPMQMEPRSVGRANAHGSRLGLPSKLVVALAFLGLASIAANVNLVGLQQLAEVGDGMIPQTVRRSFLPSQKLSPTIFLNISDVPRVTSSGPRDLLPGIVGLYQFENVCLLGHLTDELLMGLLYFAGHDEALMRNPKRCCPCSAPLNHNGGWAGTGRDQHVVNHTCGMEGMHAMFAASVEDFDECNRKPEVQRQRKVWAQNYLPGSSGEHPEMGIEQVHWYDEPVLHLEFSANIGHALFDHMLAYLPYWHAFKQQSHFPFRGVTTYSHEGCLTNSGGWYCEILRAMNAFGPAREASPSGDSGSDNTTLHCYKNVTVTHVAIQRGLKYPEQIPKHMFDEFRATLFASFGLQREREFHSNQGNATKSRKILLYAHEPSGRRVWLGMKQLIMDIGPRFKDLQLDIIDDFGALTVREQAHLWNGYDAHIMVHGAQMANSIFAVDKTFFVEIGCRIPSFIGNPKFLKLLDAQHMKVEKCAEGKEDRACVVCDTNDLVYGNFTMTEKGFYSLLDEVSRKMGWPQGSGIPENKEGVPLQSEESNPHNQNKGKGPMPSPREPLPSDKNTSPEPRVHYSVLTLKSTLEKHPERRQNVERIEREFPQFIRDMAIDASTEYEEINRIFHRHNVTCDPRNILKLGNAGLWASTLRRWELLIEEKEKWDFAVVVQDDHIYDEKMHNQVTKMVRNRWQYFRGENSLPMYSFGHGDGINLYTVSALPRLIDAFHDHFGNKESWPGGNPFHALDYFYDSLGLASENRNFAWSKIIKAHENSTLNAMGDQAKVECSPNGKYIRVD